jgi:hypothetical protein
MKDATILGIDQTPNADDIADCSRKLNMLVKQWQGKADFGGNLKTWSRKTGYVFLQKGQSVYSLGPSGDNATSSYVTTTLSVSKAANATSITVASTTGMTIGDNIGLVLSSGSIGWTTISAIPGTITLPANSLGAAASGARIFAYTTKVRRPLNLLTAVIRDTNTLDTPLVVNKKREDYEAIPDKTADGTPSWLAYEATLTNGTLYLDIEPDDVTKVIRIVFLGTIEDFDALTDTPDYPQEWYRPLVAQLAIDICPMYGKPVSQELMIARNEALSIAQNTDPETTDVFFEPGRD